MSETILEIKELKNPSEQSHPPRTFSRNQKREVVVILGPSGCGKSTLLRCLNGLESIQGGDIFLDGQSIVENKKNFHLVRIRLAWSFKVMNSFPIWMSYKTSS